MSGNSANNADDYSYSNTCIAEQNQKHNHINSAAIMSNRFYPDLLRSSSAALINGANAGCAVDITSGGSSSIDSDSTLVAMPDEEIMGGSSSSGGNKFLGFNDMVTPNWTNWQNIYSHNDQFDPYSGAAMTNSSTLPHAHQFQQHHNYNYLNFDNSPYKYTISPHTGFYNPPQQWMSNSTECSSMNVEGMNSSYASVGPIIMV